MELLLEREAGWELCHEDKCQFQGHKCCGRESVCLTIMFVVAVFASWASWKS
jgi:hypothetical protein